MAQTAGAAGVLGLGIGATRLARPGASITESLPRARTVRSDAWLPRHADVVVVGGGITGVVTALNLAERGMAVAICEKGSVAGEASGRAAGYVESAFVGPSKYEITARAKALWSRLSERAGSDTSYRSTGTLQLFADEEELQGAEGWVDSVKNVPGFDPQLVDSQFVASLIGTPHTDLAGALYLPSDGVVDPLVATSVIAEGTRAMGATIHQECAVRGIETTAGRVSAAVTEKGVIRTSNVVVAGGVWSPLFCRNLDLELPQLQAFASSLSLEPLEAGPAISGAYGPDFWRREPDGGFLFSTVDAVAPITMDTFRYGLRFLGAYRETGQFVRLALGSEFWCSLRMPSHWALDVRSPFEDVRVLAPEARIDILRERLGILGKSFPAFRGAIVREAWGGALTTTPDNLPVLGTVESIPGLTLGTGLYHGITQGPAAGELLADLVMGMKPSIEHSGFRYERLVDGSALEFQH